jgi:hypothetical protein
MIAIVSANLQQLQDRVFPDRVQDRGAGGSSASGWLVGASGGTVGTAVRGRALRLGSSGVSVAARQQAYHNRSTDQGMLCIVRNVLV